ncbi:ribose 5-phosphate isomerase B [Proteinivorax hydrogeniformans]|uniref:Ribose 5-phosphate isomerase B n=1 Tax=Proteinivorax hydrogeniformans TaxID=1826727 RepID=A0AAU8HSR1_9FIRM
MKIALASDHGGYRLKSELNEFIKNELKLETKDFGTHGPESVDYPEYAKVAADAVINKECDFAILVCGTGIGISIAANKIKGIRAANCHDCFSAEATRLHNDANVLALGERVVGGGLAKKIVQTFLTTNFEGGRHLRRVEKITKLES